MMLGQDEAIMQRNLFSLFSWTLLDGSKALLPKDKEHGVMISACTSRETVFDFSLPESCLKEINKLSKGKEYNDKQAEMLLFG